MINYKVSNTEGHAVKYWGTDPNGNIMIYDPTGGVPWPIPLPVPSGSIINSFKIIK